MDDPETAYEGAQPNVIDLSRQALDIVPKLMPENVLVPVLSATV
ncbi:MAG TPA: hypothetical protein VGF12_01060 [Roseateles sp.]